MLIHRTPDPALAEAAQRAILADERLSLITVAVLMKCLSRAPEWQVNAKTFHELCVEGRGLRAESKRAIRMAFRELEETGYMRRTRGKKSSGDFYTWLEISDVPGRFVAFAAESPPSEPVAGWDHGVMPVEGTVYVIGSANSTVVKIGTTGNVETRLRGMQTSNPLLLLAHWSCRGNVELESYLHRRFDEIRMKGEWFNFGTADPVADVRAAAEEFYQLPAGALSETADAGVAG